MEDSNDFQAIASQPVRDDVRRSRHDKFPGASNATRAAEIGQRGEALDGFEECAGDSTGGPGVVTREVCAEMSKVLDRSRRPDDGHTRGGFRSRLRPHEPSHFATSLCATPRPASSSAIPA